MEYAIISLSPEKEEKLAEKIAVAKDTELRVLFGEYAPRVWIVSYKGGQRQLTDLLWPDSDLYVSDCVMVWSPSPVHSGFLASSGIGKVKTVCKTQGIVHHSLILLLTTFRHAQAHLPTLKSAFTPCLMEKGLL